MAKVMVSIPDELLGAVDSEAARRGTTRSAVLQAGARHEVGLAEADRDALLEEMDRLSRDWRGPVDAGLLVRRERERDA
jgi:metal-responsive CopG/Arc/MetJ family transcriptional regulator